MACVALRPFPDLSSHVVTFPEVSCVVAASAASNQKSGVPAKSGLYPLLVTSVIPGKTGTLVGPNKVAVLFGRNEIVPGNWDI